jgi:hypothetical protein
MSRSCSTRSSRAWFDGERSPTSSSSSVPSFAASKTPTLRARAPVKLPRSWPKSSLSAMLSGSAAQLMAMKGAPARRECRCSARATTS